MRNARRILGLTSAAAVAGLALSACAGGATGGAGSSPATAGPIVWADYGGTSNEAYNDIYFTPFTAESGTEVISTTIEGSIQNAMLGGDPGDYDIMMTGLAETVKYGDNLLELPADVPRSDQLPAAVAPYAVANSFVGYAQGYLAGTFPNGGPRTWADFWDVEAFPGKRAVPGEYFDFMFEAALLADGVAPDDLYPLDLDRAVAKLDRLKPSLVYYTEYPQVQQLLTSGGASIAFAPNGLYAGLSNDGIAVAVSWDQAFIEANPFVVPSAAAHPEAAFELARFMADPQRQAEFAKRTNYGPSSSEAFTYLTDEEIDRLPNAPSHTTVVWPDAQARADQYDDMTQRYTTWLTS
ncbi:extracellular solute-binding protein [Microbacterium sp. SORGH_AS_0888]|uniref:extracellular solute-binding protein n=1 Tax=Microbacterium sp. SORGH_AS_0888 TaxID=3041791 RepID=UPI0027D79917|nr:extracellular solute-binding protein [Microbacterium sp. SORGH_AS_0888]